MPSRRAASLTRRAISGLRGAAVEGERDVLIHRHVRLEGVVLEHHRDVAVAGGQSVTSFSPMRMAPPVDLLETGDHAERVVLPQPQGPTRTRNPPSGMSRVDGVDRASRSRTTSSPARAGSQPCRCDGIDQNGCRQPRNATNFAKLVLTKPPDHSYTVQMRAGGDQREARSRGLHSSTACSSLGDVEVDGRTPDRDRARVARTGAGSPCPGSSTCR